MLFGFQSSYWFTISVEVALSAQRGYGQQRHFALSHKRFFGRLSGMMAFNMDAME